MAAACKLPSTILRECHSEDLVNEIPIVSTAIKPSHAPYGRSIRFSCALLFKDRLYFFSPNHTPVLLRSWLQCLSTSICRLFLCGENTMRTRGRDSQGWLWPLPALIEQLVLSVGTFGVHPLNNTITFTWSLSRTGAGITDTDRFLAPSILRTQRYQ